MKRVDKLIEKSQVLIEALPYLKKFGGKNIVVKVGGETLWKNMKSIVRDVVFLHELGMRPVFVHGGGAEISRELNRARIKPVFVNGLRVTDERTMKVVEKVLTRVNQRLVKELEKHGTKVIGVSGRDNRLLQCVQKDKKLGRVGTVAHVNPTVLNSVIDDGFLPVVCTVGVGKDGGSMNINADEAAASLAVALKAEKLTVMSNVDGILVNGKLVSSVTRKQATQMVDKKIITGGMIPKVRSCLQAVKGGVRKAHIVNGLVPHALLLEIYTNKGIGTEVVP